MAPRRRLRLSPVLSRYNRRAAVYREAFMLEFLNRAVFGPILPVFLLLAGLFLAFRFRFFLLRHPIRIVKSLFRKQGGEVSPFRAACLALSGTLGVGNIAGVAAAIATGGPGAVFWMWVSAFFAMFVKYGEVVAAMHWKKNGRGGAAYAIELGLGKRAPAVLYSVLLLLASFTVGNIVQSSAAAEAMAGSFSVPRPLTGLVFAGLTLFLLRGGVGRLASFSATVIPLLSLGYIVLSLAILTINRALIPGIFAEILSGALSPSAVGGGALGLFLTRALRCGVSRGILSNEAGCGTAAYAHASAENDPVAQGFFGVFEVFVDTILLCTLTAFVVLIAFPGGPESDNGMQTAIQAYSAFGGWGGAFIAASSAIYALASVVCWSYYGQESLLYLEASPRLRQAYLVLYGLTGVVGAFFAPAAVWELSDLTVSLMATVHTACLLLISGTPAKLTASYFSKTGGQLNGYPRSRSVCSFKASGKTGV